MMRAELERKKAACTRQKPPRQGRQHRSVASILRGRSTHSSIDGSAHETAERESCGMAALERKHQSETAAAVRKKPCCAACGSEAELPAGGGSPADKFGDEMVELTTGGSSRCNLSGNSQSITNNNDECSRSCTQAHEENHVSRRSTCCERARTAYHAARDAGDATKRSEIMSAWNAWVRANRAPSECEAYGVSVSCATNLIRENNCDSEETPSTCCTQLSSYLSHVTNRRDHYCGQSGDSTDRTDCPDFS